MSLNTTFKTISFQPEPYATIFFSRIMKNSAEVFKAMVSFTPFFKIRFIATTLAFLLLFLLVGFGKWCFAGTTFEEWQASDCRHVARIEDTTTNRENLYAVSASIGYDSSNGTFFNIGPYVNPPTDYYNHKYMSRFWSVVDGGWMSYKTYVYASLGNADFEFIELANEPSDCVLNCKDIIAAAEAACEFGSYSYDCDLGTYQCEDQPNVPNQDPGKPCPLVTMGQ